MVVLISEPAVTYSFLKLFTGRIDRIIETFRYEPWWSVAIRPSADFHHHSFRDRLFHASVPALPSPVFTSFEVSELLSSFGSTFAVALFGRCRCQIVTTFLVVT